MATLMNCFVPILVLVSIGLIFQARKLPPPAGYFPYMEELPFVIDTSPVDPLILKYSVLFKNLMARGFLSRDDVVLCVETQEDKDVLALLKMGVSRSYGISNNGSGPWKRQGHALNNPFPDNTFNVEFIGFPAIDLTPNPTRFASEISRTLKQNGVLVVHTETIDAYTIDSLQDLFQGVSNWLSQVSQYRSVL